MQNVWAKHIVDSISTALCSFLHIDLTCYVCKTWSMFTLSNTHNLRVVV